MQSSHVVIASASTIGSVNCIGICRQSCIKCMASFSGQVKFFSVLCQFHSGFLCCCSCLFFLYLVALLSRLTFLFHKYVILSHSFAFRHFHAIYIVWKRYLSNRGYIYTYFRNSLSHHIIIIIIDITIHFSINGSMYARTQNAFGMFFFNFSYLHCLQIPLIDDSYWENGDA